jgi:hypothetical protein
LSDGSLRAKSNNSKAGGVEIMFTETTWWGWFGGDCGRS